MNGFTCGPGQMHRLQSTRLTDLCQELRRAFAERLAGQGVRLSCDVDANLTCDLPQPLVRQILSDWIDEALTKMPHGGQLDLTFVVSRRGLEIEVADSRETDVHETQSYWHRNVQISDGSGEWMAGAEVRVETALCPQGGVARTVMVTHHPSTGAASPQQAWRKVA